eukprot:304784-Chlamydomonas_euryale.AAC.1
MPCSLTPQPNLSRPTSTPHTCANVVLMHARHQSRSGDPCGKFAHTAHAQRYAERWPPSFSPGSSAAQAKHHARAAAAAAAGTGAPGSPASLPSAELPGSGTLEKLHVGG